MIIIWEKAIFSSSFPACQPSWALFWQEAEEVHLNQPLPSINAVTATASGLTVSFWDHSLVFRHRAPPPSPYLSSCSSLLLEGPSGTPSKPTGPCNPIMSLVWLPQLTSYDSIPHPSIICLPTSWISAGLLYHLHNAFLDIFFKSTSSFLTLTLVLSSNLH